MKKTSAFAIIACSTLLLFTACKKDVKESIAPDEVSATAIAQIKSMGFGTADVKKMDGGYLVEGDIFLPESDLGVQPTSPHMIIAQEEQYRTFNLVNSGSYPTINVALNNSSAEHQAVFSAALDNAIARYNARNLTIRFQRVSSGANITVTAYYEVSNTLGFAGFPPGNGAPYDQVQMNTYHYSTSTSSTNVNYLATIMAHELGHCIGFRHTDYMNRSYSCGNGGSEGSTNSGIGAVHIPGTPTGPNAASWMLACSNGSNRPFNSSDRTALAYVY